MSDIQARLILNTSDYDSKLRKARRSTSDFADSIVSKAGAAIGKFAAGIGVAMGGVEAFKKMMDSTQTTGDLMRGTMQVLKTSVDEFFYSINTGNFKNFLTGLDDMIGKARQAYAAMDQLGNTQMSFGVFSAKNQAAIAEAQYLAKNKFAPTSERISAFGNWRSAIENEQGNIEALQRELIATKAVQSRINANIEVTLEDIMRAFETDLLKEDSRTLIKSRAEMGFRNYNVNAKRDDWTQEQKDALAEIQKENIITYTMLEKYNNDELKQIAQLIPQYYSLINAVKGLGREYNETANEFNNANKGVAGFNPVDSLYGYTVYSGGEAGKNFGGAMSGTVKAASGSLAAIDAEIRKAQQEYANTASAAAREAAMRTIEELQNKKGLIELHARVSIPSVGSGKSGSLAALAGGLPTTLGSTPLSIKSEDVKNASDYADAINSVANALTAVSTATGEGAAAFLSWASSVMTASAQAVQAIQTVVAAKTAEAAASAGASAASTPVVGWLMIGGAIAAALAAFAKIPKFADGGIVGGSSFFGDKLLARVNSGEMILNQGQQARLLSMTEGGNVRVTGDVRLNGKDIYISLRNYMASSGNRL